MKAVLIKYRTSNIEHRTPNAEARPGPLAVRCFREFLESFVRAGLILLATTAASAAIPELAPTTNIVQLTPAYLSQLAEEMRANNPSLQAAYARTNAALAGVNAVRTWEDPMALLGGMAAREPLRGDAGQINHADT